MRLAVAFGLLLSLSTGAGCGGDPAAPTGPAGGSPTGQGGAGAGQGSGGASASGAASGAGGSEAPVVDPPPSNIARVDVATVDELLAALAAATPGSVVYVADDAELDLTGLEDIHIPGQVTLMSGGVFGGVGGAKLFTTAHDTMPLLRAAGSGVRVTGLRIIGPDTAIGKEPYDPPVSRGIAAEKVDNLQVDHCELAGWPHAAILLSYSERGYVHHNDIHHNRRTGLGYGVVLVAETHALIERNSFDYNRHSIAGTGKPKVGYEARYNFVGPNRNGHAFDMHGENEASGNGSKYAGDLIDIHHNTFLGTSAKAVLIRGVPKIGGYIEYNCFAHSSAGGAYAQSNFTGNIFASNNEFGQANGKCHEGAAPLRQTRGDVNNDGIADLVTLVDGTAYTYLGSPEATLVPAHPALVGSVPSALWYGEGNGEGEGQLAIDVADVDGDLHNDLVTAGSDGTVRVHRGAPMGTFLDAILSLHGAYPLATAATPDDAFEPIAVADVNGDGFGDLVSHRKGSVLVHPGTADATFGEAVESFAGTFASARFDGIGHLALDVADVTGDGRADLVTQHDNGNGYVYPGKSDGTFGSAAESFHETFVNALVDGAGFEAIGVGDVNGDGRADLVSTHTDGFAYTYPGAASGTFGSRVESFDGTLPTSLFGADGFEVVAPLDMNGDGRVDLVTVRDGTVRVYPGTSAGKFTSAVESFADGGFLTAREHARAFEPVSEKRDLRRRGCKSSGCFQ